MFAHLQQRGSGRPEINTGAPAQKPHSCAPETQQQHRSSAAISGFWQQGISRASQSFRTAQRCQKASILCHSSEFSRAEQAGRRRKGRCCSKRKEAKIEQTEEEEGRERLCDHHLDFFSLNPQKEIIFFFKSDTI